MRSVRAQVPPEPSSASEDERGLFERWQRHGDRAAREELVQRHLGLARSLARRYARSSEPLDDLLQVASVGLLNAIDRFDVERGSAFTSFAVPTILGELRRYFRDCGWSVQMPRGLQERALRVDEAQQQLMGEKQRSPTVDDVAEYLEISSEDVLSAMQAAQAYAGISLEAPCSSREGESSTTYGEIVGADDERYALVEADASIASALEHLEPRERAVLHLRFAKDMTQTEIAARLGVSQMQVSRLLRRSLERLRTLTGAAQESPDAS